MIVFSNRLKLETTNGSFVSPPPFRCAKFCTSRWVASQTTARRRALWQSTDLSEELTILQCGDPKVNFAYTSILYIYIYYICTYMQFFPTCQVRVSRFWQRCNSFSSSSPLPLGGSRPRLDPNSIPYRQLRRQLAMPAWTRTLAR